MLDNGDQDTEFGVEVDRSRETYMRVFRGLITFRVPGFQPYPCSREIASGRGRARTP